ncbi:Bardet-Biedl syndrome 2 protein homolog isoform X2 [Vespula pensylvanica]|uniref:Bardet-Biedl syndrome 2 protein homolog isoform X2 n=1 Tax=Vespula pensylvanica TaxID=30213 RepID=UPI001CBA018D|nr:Bardet-Biedl syndrome 2 protein homolog isoform X2 [Vespula pensylvanica]
MAAFSLNIQKHIESGLVASGKFDGSHACLTAVTSGGNILVHSPHRQPQIKNNDSEQPDGRLSWSGELAELQIDSQVTAICTGHLGEDERDILLIGTATHILAYHVEDNADIFYKEMTDGALYITIGKLGWLTDQVAVVGGNSSITVLDSKGTEIFWTVMGDIVTSIAIFDFEGDHENELLIGTKDFEIKLLKEDAIVWDTKETASVTALAGLSNKQFAYAVGNGTIGVYEGGQRLWRVKSKHRAVSIRNFDINGDGVLELITGWSSGKVDARSCNTGDVIFKIQLSTGVAGIVEADYRRQGRPDLVAVSVSGEVRGYAPGTAMDAPEPGEIMRELMSKKQALQMELRQRAASVPNMYHHTKLAVSLISARGAARLGVAAGPGLLVHCAIVFAEGVFEGETLVAHPNRPQGELEIELRPPKNGPIDIHVKISVGPAGADLLQVFEMTRQLPRFCMYEIISHPEEASQTVIDSGVTMEVAERAQRIALWLNQSLLLAEEFEVAEEGPNAASIELWLRGLRDNKVHCFTASPSGKITVQTEDSTFAGDIVQSLAMYLGLRELNSESKFPNDESKMLEALERVKGYISLFNVFLNNSCYTYRGHQKLIKGLKDVDAKLQAEAASTAVLLKSVVIRLEDARILQNVEEMRKRLLQLKAINSDLIRNHEIRMNSNRDLSINLKELNIGVQRVAKLRVGKAATNAVSRCRTAIQDENPKALLAAMRNG